jgi:hypothetical protein
MNNSLFCEISGYLGVEFENSCLLVVVPCSLLEVYWHFRGFLLPPSVIHRPDGGGGKHLWIVGTTTQNTAISNPAFCIYVFHMVLTVTGTLPLNSINKLMLLMAKSCVYFAVRTEFLNIGRSPASNDWYTTRCAVAKPVVVLYREKKVNFIVAGKLNTGYGFVCYKGLLNS